MNHKTILLILFIGLFIHGKGQSNETISLDKEKKNSIFFAPYNFVSDLVNPSFQIGYERMISDKYAIQVEGAYIMTNFMFSLVELTMGDKLPYTNNGFKIRTEFKYFLSSHEYYKTYLSCELFYLKNKSYTSDYFNVSDTSFTYSPDAHFDDGAYWEDFINDKQKYGLNLKFGMKFFLGKWFFIEPHVGIGIAYRISKQYDRENLNDPLLFKLLSFGNRPGAMIIPNFPINVKLGVRF